MLSISFVADCFIFIFLSCIELQQFFELILKIYLIKFFDKIYKLLFSRGTAAVNTSHKCYQLLLLTVISLVTEYNHIQSVTICVPMRLVCQKITIKQFIKHNFHKTHNSVLKLLVLSIWCNFLILNILFPARGKSAFYFTSMSSWHKQIYSRLIEQHFFFFFPEVRLPDAM